MSFKVPEQFRIQTGQMASHSGYGNNGAFEFKRNGFTFFIIASDGMGWEHVSVHCRANKKDITPTWEQMCFVKNLFWSDDDCVVQFHPPKSEYVNIHNHTLHLWKQVKESFQTPEKIMV